MEMARLGGRQERDSSEEWNFGRAVDARERGLHKAGAGCHRRCTRYARGLIIRCRYLLDRL